MTRAFLRELQETVSERTGRPLRQSTISRVFASLRHFSRWLCKERPPMAGDPLAGVRVVMADAPAFKALSSKQVLRLKLACEQRLGGKRRKDQEPRLEAAVLLVLLYTGLREHELVRLDLSQYHHRGLHHVRRKGAKVSTKVPVPGQAREALERYLDEVRGREAGPLFVSRRAQRLSVRGVAYICERLARQASVHLPPAERFHLAPHQLRHTFLKGIADKHGTHVAQEMSGNIGVREIFRYTKPSSDEMEANAEGVF